MELLTTRELKDRLEEQHILVRHFKGEKTGQYLQPELIRWQPCQGFHTDSIEAVIMSPPVLRTIGWLSAFTSILS